MFSSEIRHSSYNRKPDSQPVSPSSSPPVSPSSSLASDPLAQSILANTAPIRQPNEKQKALNNAIREAEKHLVDPDLFEPCLHNFLSESDPEAAANYLIDKMNSLYESECVLINRIQNDDHKIYKTLRSLAKREELAGETPVFIEVESSKESQFLNLSKSLSRISDKFDMLFMASPEGSEDLHSPNPCGLQLMIDFMKDKKTLPPNTDYQIFQDTYNFGHNVLRFFSSEEKKEAEKYCIFIDNNNYSVIYLHKEISPQRNSIFVLDGLFDPEASEEKTKSIIKCFNAQSYKSLSTNTTMFISKVQTQFSKEDSIKYLIRTLKEVTRNPAAFRNYIYKHLLPQATPEPVRVPFPIIKFDDLPEGMVDSSTDSVSKVQQVISDHKGTEEKDEMKAFKSRDLSVEATAALSASEEEKQGGAMEKSSVYIPEYEKLFAKMALAKCISDFQKQGKR